MRMLMMSAFFVVGLPSRTFPAAETHLPAGSCSEAQLLWPPAHVLAVDDDGVAVDHPGRAGNIGLCGDGAREGGKNGW
jgi:hypothetical protein